jgi:undecaprenyl-diphosphatase
LGILRSISAGQLFPKDDIDSRLGWYTVFGTIPLAIFGLLLEKRIDHEYRNLYFVAGALILLAIALLAAEKVGKRNRNLDSLKFNEAMMVGLAQVLAIVPGASRSGTTITAGLFLGMDRESAARFSFLLSIPAIALAGLYHLYKYVIKAHASVRTVAGPYIFSTVVAGIVAYIVVRWLLGYLSKESHTTMPFIIYRIVLGVALIVLARTGLVMPGG